MIFSLTLILIYSTGLQGLHVQGPSGPLVTQLGASVLLPCFTQNPLPLEGLQVEWWKTESDSLVNIFQQGESKPQLQSEAFRGRVHFFPDEIPKGNFSILLQNVVKNDTGVYRCKVHGIGETLLEMKNVEHLVVKGSDHALSASVGDDVTLNCSVGSNVLFHEIEEVTWRRTDRDTLILLFLENEVVSDATDESYQGRAEFFVDQMPKGNFSLKLKDVKTEDKGEYKCEVHTKQLSAHAVVVLQKLGFSFIHVLILLLSSIALLLAVGLGVPTFVLLRKAERVTSKKLMKINALLIICPNICLCAAFILWTTEGFLNEVIICSTVSIIRPLMLVKTCPTLNKLPMWWSNAVKVLAIPVYHSVTAISVCSVYLHNIRQAQTSSEHIMTVLSGLAAVPLTGAIILAWFSHRMHSTVCMEICNAAVLGFTLSQSKEEFDTSIQVSSETAPIIVAILMVLSLQRHYCQGKYFRKSHIVLSSVIITLFSLAEITVFILLGISMRSFARPWLLLLEAVLFIIAWVAVVFLLRSKRCQRQPCFSKMKGIGYLCCAVILAFLMAAYGSLCLHYITQHMKNKTGYAGHMTVTTMIHVLAVTSIFQHPRTLPDFPHLIVYMFGAVGLIIVNFITLAIELILKAEKGVRTIEDLRAIVLPFETMFLSAWLSLEIFSFWMRTKHRIKAHFKDEQETAVQEMENLSPAGGQTT